ncbi:hypothetical protein CHS0354_016828 [Potamilus streckersoni]|uniref:Uncharacterized protein n=1 Tax=Potamilus streckersoni TaxID=2493646 RepID=A0AAE0SVC7_9BIVA|nr:hypothetical protein CHS0354_016828 [Potamilus streckersoni]
MDVIEHSCDSRNAVNTDVMGSGPCDFWVGATEAASGVWSGLNSKPLSTLGGIFFQLAGDFDDSAASECGMLDDSKSFYLYGEPCASLKCYICQRNKIY